jgi:hypothetical protein
MAKKTKATTSAPKTQPIAKLANQSNVIGLKPATSNAAALKTSTKADSTKSSAKNTKTSLASSTSEAGKVSLSAIPRVKDVSTAADPKTLPKADQKVQESLAKKPAGSLQSPLRIFQIYYEAWQRELLDPNFAALDNSKGNSEFLEFAVFEKLAKSDYVKGAQLWGALSWRFTEKTGMSGEDLIKYIKGHPNADVYYCNPFPHNEALFHNMWLQGETTHPQFLALSQAVFQVTGLPQEELTAMMSSEHYSAANYFVATPKFWNAYLPWVMNVMSLANKKLPPKVRDLLHSAQADDRGLHQGASYVPFIVERLFPVFMKTAGKSLKAHKVPLPERERELNVHLKLLREMKDVAHKTNSAWLAACWVNYRNLYLTQANGKAWCTKYLRAITPTDIKFS